MVFESSLAPQATRLADSLNVRPAPTVEKTADEQSQDSKTPAQNGDMISISKEARALIAAESTGNDSNGDSPFNLTDQEKRQANRLFGELDTIFSSGKELSADQEKRVDNIFGELDKLFPVEEEYALTAEEEKQVDALFGQLNELHENNKELTPDQEKQASKIEGKIESIFMAAEQREEAGGQGVSINAAEAAEKGGVAGKQKSSEEQAIDRLKEQIETLKEEIAALEKEDIPEKEKNQQLQAKQAQLMELNDQLLKAQQAQLKAQGASSGGGTRASGFGNSVGTF